MLAGVTGVAGAAAVALAAAAGWASKLSPICVIPGRSGAGVALAAGGVSTGTEPGASLVNSPSCRVKPSSV